MAAILSVGVAVDMSPAGKLANELQRKRVAAKAIGRGAKKIIPSARSKAQKRSGTLKRSIGSKAFPSKRKKTGAVGVVGARRKIQGEISRGGKKVIVVPADYAHLVEFGTRPHSLAKGATLKRKSGTGVDRLQGVGAQHPGAKPYPFMEPAWNAKKGEVMYVVSTEMVKEVQKQIERNARTAFKNLR